VHGTNAITKIHSLFLNVRPHQMTAMLAVLAVRPVGSPVWLLSPLLGSPRVDPAQFQVHICFTRMIREYQRHGMWQQILSCQAVKKSMEWHVVVSAAE